ncbi:hypothetical protein [Nitrospira sp. Nam80]
MAHYGASGPRSLATGGPVGTRLAVPHRSLTYRILISIAFALLFVSAAPAQEKGSSPFHVVPFNVDKVAWITLTEKLEVVIAFKDPIDEIHSAMWTKARDIEAALKLLELFQKSLIQSLEINTKDPLSLRDVQRCKVRCEIVGLRFAPTR